MISRASLGCNKENPMPSSQKQAHAARTDARPTPEQFLFAFPPEIRDLAEQLRQTIKQTIPSIAEAVYPSWKLIGYRELDGKRRKLALDSALWAGRILPL
jgi:hypothetical protein